MKQNQQSLALELLKLCSIVYLVMYKYGFPSCSIIFQSSIFKCSEEFDSSSFHHLFGQDTLTCILILLYYTFANTRTLSHRIVHHIN